MGKAYVLEFPGNKLAANREMIDRCIMPQSTCAGACVFICWAEIEQRQGVFNWSAIDARLDQWQGAGKRCVLIVWGMDYRNPNTSTPSWVMADPAYESVHCDYYGDMPIPYRGAYKDRYKTFIQRTMQKYASDQRVDTIRFGLGVGGETYPACYYTLLNLEGQSADQFDELTWKPYVDEMWSTAHKAPHKVTLDAAMNHYGDPPRLSTCDWIASWADAHDWSFGTQGLSQADIDAHTNDQPTVSNWLQNFGRHHSTPTHLQTKSATDPHNNPEGAGSLDTLVPFALDHGCEAFEIYLEDWRIAYDPEYAGYQQYGAAYRGAFEEICNS